MKIKINKNLVVKSLHYLTIYSLLHVEEKTSDFENLLIELEKIIGDDT